MQNQRTYENTAPKNGFHCALSLWKKGGIRSFYKGCMPQMVGVAPEKAIKLFIYSAITQNNQDELKYHLFGGILAGASQVIVTSPYEMIKINYQMNNRISLIKLATHRNQIYRGASACFLRDIPFSGIYFPLYWFLKDKQQFHPLIAGMLAGVPSSFLCTPADVVKTRMQTMNTDKNFNLIEVIFTIFKNEGFRAFWKGGGWRVLRSSPQFGITLVCYEYLKTKYDYLHFLFV